jgi:hypothetical protein
LVAATAAAWRAVSYAFATATAVIGAFWMAVIWDPCW